MTVLSIEKVAVLPEVLAADTLYFVKTESGVEVYVSTKDQDVISALGLSVKPVTPSDAIHPFALLGG